MKVNRHALRWVLFFTLIVALSFIPLIESKSANPAANEPQPAPSLPTDRPFAGALSEQQTPGIALSTTSGVAQFDNDETDCEHLPRDNWLRLELNGPRLRLRYNRLEKGSEKRLLRESKVLPLSDGRILAGLGDTLYMLDGGKQVEWTYTPSWILWDFTVVESTGRIYGTAGDNIMFILDASNGKELYSNGRNGKAAYCAVVPFGKDMCLISDNFAGYRDDPDEWKTSKLDWILPDGITAWRGTEALWHMDFPPDAELVVRGDKIYAVTKTDKSIYFREIIPPKTDSKR